MRPRLAGPARLAPAAFALLLLANAACAYFLPASWRAVRADPDDAAPAITRVLDAAGIGVASYDPEARQITSQWLTTAGSSGLARARERYVVTWEKERKEDDILTVRVRHEQQEQDRLDEGRPTWGAVTHDAKREEALLEKIVAELRSS